VGKKKTVNTSRRRKGSVDKIGRHCSRKALRCAKKESSGDRGWEGGEKKYVGYRSLVGGVFSGRRKRKAERPGQKRTALLAQLLQPGLLLFKEKGHYGQRSGGGRKKKIHDLRGRGIWKTCLAEGDGRGPDPERGSALDLEGANRAPGKKKKKKTKNS